MSIENFLNEFDKLQKNPITNNMANSDKIALFSVYCNLRKAQQPKPSQPSQQPQRGNTRPNNGRPSNFRPASDQQVRLLNELISQGDLSRNTDLDGLSRAQASKLIEEGITNSKAKSISKKHRNQPQDEADEEDDGEFTGSYNAMPSDDSDLPF